MGASELSSRQTLGSMPMAYVCRSDSTRCLLHLARATCAVTVHRDVYIDAAFSDVHRGNQAWSRL
jgi:hypothetical protein